MKRRRFLLLLWMHLFASRISYPRINPKAITFCTFSAKNLQRCHSHAGGNLFAIFTAPFPYFLFDVPYFLFFHYLHNVACGRDVAVQRLYRAPNHRRVQPSNNIRNSGFISINGMNGKQTA
jgi:hypothetical protein